MADELEKLDNIKQEFNESLKVVRTELKEAETEEEIQTRAKEIIDTYLGDSAELNAILSSLKDIEDKSLKKDIGTKANKLRNDIESKTQELQSELQEELIEKRLKKESIPANWPTKSTKQEYGHKHIVTQEIQRIEDIFTKMGFGVEYSLEIDTPENAFDFVNIPESHPARDSWDTLWMDDGNLAIPHTSAMQNRILSEGELPIRKVIIGKCFRNEATDATHEHTFYQLEGVYLDQNVNMGEMLGVLIEFLKAYYKKDFNYKFTPDYFPFVEPGAQMAIDKSVVTGNNEIKSKSDYLEILGCGMIHPRVIEMAGKDPEKYSGFAWGVGLERLLLLKYGIDDIRNFYSGDLRFIKQF
jgi:phenylalanyl-tRNA synthetase alpha chain